MNNLSPSPLFFNPPSSLAGAAGLVAGLVRAGDVFEIVVGSPVALIYSPVKDRDVTAYLEDSGIAHNVVAQYQPGPPHTQGTGKLIITGIAAADWRSGSELCAAVLQLVSKTGYVIHTGNWLACTITPAAPAETKFESPNWLILLALGIGLWWLWKSGRK